MSKILLFNISGDKLSRIQEICARLSIECAAFEAVDFSRSLYELTTGLSTDRTPSYSAKAEIELFKDEMLVMEGLDEERFNALLRDLRSEGAPVALKAVLTEHNIYWTAAQLARELAAEHAMMLEAIRAAKSNS